MGESAGVRNVIRIVFATILVGASGCADTTMPTGPTVELAIQRPPDLIATVFQARHAEFASPAGWVSQDELWTAGPGSTTADAGVVVMAARPVFISSNGSITAATASDIRVGDVIQVWHDASVTYGAVQAPPGAPCYFGLQIVIVR